MKLYHKIILLSLIAGSVIVYCQPKPLTADDIINKSIDAHGGDLYEQSIMSFDFRGRHYKFERDHGNFVYHRIFSDTTGEYHDILTNSSFERTLNNEQVSLSDEWVRRYSNSVNSVAYFALLPFGLNDPAVRKTLLEEEEINGNNYYKVRVTFSQEGGGEDYEDVFVYWINKSTFKMDYFGYYYKNDGGGIRFREATNMRKLSGIVFSDYINYKGEDGDTEVSLLASKFKNGTLKKLSEIQLENLQVIRISNR